MTLVLWLLVIEGALGAFDTLYYHEWKARLVAEEGGRAELALHAARDFIYAVLFGTLAWWTPRGGAALAGAVLLAAEVAITITDFIVEDQVRRPLGGVFPGERAMHAVMGIVYGAMLGHLVPHLIGWVSEPTELRAATTNPVYLSWALSVMAGGVLVSGLRDLYAVMVMPHAAWPWRRREAAA